MILINIYRGLKTIVENFFYDAIKDAESELRIKKKDWEEKEAELDKLMNKDDISFKNKSRRERWDEIMEKNNNET